MDDRTPDRRQQIIEAAFRVFSRKGFQGASNREIAEEAGIAPGLIYRYFRNKEDLFLAVAEAKSPAVPLARLLGSMAEAPPREFFLAVAREIGRVFASETTRAAARLLLADGLRHESLRQLWRERVVEPILQGLTAYIRRQVAGGRLRPIEPEAAARLFVGTVMSQVLISFVLGDDPANEQLAPLLEQAAEVFWQGVAPPAEGGTGGGTQASTPPGRAIEVPEP
ncbi:MAG TPA: TetR/AcrR family transcriptional regulator, partial [Gemmataceae bacterium]